MRTLVLLASAAIAVPGCRGEAEKSSPTAQVNVAPVKGAAVDIQNPETCAACHPRLVREWNQSMHARAHHDRDPIYAGIRRIRMKKEGADIAKACAGCHTPGFENDPDAAAATVGVGCATCHNARIEAAPGVLLGPNDVAAGASPAHATGPADHAIADGTTVCMSCHASMDSPKGLSMCATGAEHAAFVPDERKSCSQCHMPRAEGEGTVGTAKPDHASHAFLGPHGAWYQDDTTFTSSAITVEATLVGNALRVTIENHTGHAFPTGFPGRQALVGCVGRDSAGAEVWRCEPRPLGKAYVDAAGKPTLAPYAETLAADTRIEPRATQTLEFEPPPAVTHASVEVAMRLVPQRLAKKLDLTDAPEGAPKIIAAVEAKRGSDPPPP